MHRLIRAIAAIRAWQIYFKMRPQHGDFVVLRAANNTMSPSAVQAFRDAITKQFAGVDIVLIRHDMSLEHIPSDQLHRFGLRRLDEGELP